MNNPLIIFKRWGTSPQNDWEAMFSVFTLLLIGVIVWGFALFVSVSHVDEEASASSGEIMNRNALHRTALYYDTKAAQFNGIKVAPETAPDPSK